MKYYSREELENSPSVQDGITAAKEHELRKRSVKYVTTCSRELKLPSWTTETAVVLCHRFYAVRSMAKNDRLLVAAAALFLACKVDESPRSLRDVAYICMKTRFKGKADETARVEQAFRGHDLVYMDQLMESIRVAERSILYTLGFELKVDHPLPVLMREMRALAGGVLTSTAAPVHNRVAQVANNFLNDSMSTTLLIEYPAQTLASAAIWQAMRVLKVDLPLPSGKTFEEHFHISTRALEDISHRFMEVYDAGTTQAAPEAASGPSSSTPFAAHSRAELPSSSAPSELHALQSLEQGPSTAPDAPSTSGRQTSGQLQDGETREELSNSKRSARLEDSANEDMLPRGENSPQEVNGGLSVLDHPSDSCCNGSRKRGSAELAVHSDELEQQPCKRHAADEGAFSAPMVA